MKLGFFTVAMIAAISGLFEHAEALRIEQEITILKNETPTVVDESAIEKSAARIQIE